MKTKIRYTPQHKIQVRVIPHESDMKKVVWPMWVECRPHVGDYMRGVHHTAQRRKIIGITHTLEKDAQKVGLMYVLEIHLDREGK